MLPPETWVPLAEIMRPHGVRGEVRLRPFNRDSELLFDVNRVLVRRPLHEAGRTTSKGAATASGEALTIEGVRRANDAILLKLRTVDDRDRAGELRGAEVCVRRADLPELEAGEFYACDMEGALVTLGSAAGDGEGHEELGRVIELRSYPSADVLVVAAVDGGRAWEVPLVDAVIDQVDVAAGVVTLKTLEGIERE